MLCVIMASQQNGLYGKIFEKQNGYMVEFVIFFCWGYKFYAI